MQFPASYVIHHDPSRQAIQPTRKTEWHSDTLLIRHCGHGLIDHSWKLETTIANDSYNHNPMISQWFQYLPWYSQSIPLTGLIHVPWMFMLMEIPYQWIGFMENLQETMVFSHHMWGFPVNFYVHQSHDHRIPESTCRKSRKPCTICSTRGDRPRTPPAQLVVTGRGPTMGKPKRPRDESQPWDLWFNHVFGIQLLWTIDNFHGY